MSANIACQKGSVMYVCRNMSQNFLALRYEGAAVIVTSELLRGKDYQADDIIEFDGVPINKTEASLYNTVKPKWKATRIKFLKRAEQWKGTAKVVTMDAQGEYCFLEGKDGKGNNCNIFCTRISVMPPVDKLGSIFSTGNWVKIVCKEQVATPKNNNVKWRTIAATDMKHDLKVKAGAPLNSYEAVPIAPQTPAKTVPKPRIAPTGPRPATAAAAVKSTPLTTVQTAAGVPPISIPAPSPLIQSAPSPALASIRPPSVTIAQVVAQETVRTVPAPISPPNLHVHDVIYAPPAEDSPTLSSLPIPSYEWMKFDLISTINGNYPTPAASELQSENRKLREISHHLSNGNCNFCLSH